MTEQQPEQDFDKEAFADEAVMHLARAAIAANDQTGDERLQRIEDAILKEVQDVRSLIKAMPTDNAQQPDPAQQAWQELQARTNANNAQMDQMLIQMMKRMVDQNG